MAYHTYLTVLIPCIVAFVLSVIAVLFIKSYMFEAGITSPDHNKRDKPTVPSSGGVAVAFGFTIGILTYIFGASFPSPTSALYAPVSPIESLFAALLAVLLVAFVGFLDDVNVKRKPVMTTDMMDTRKGLKQWQKPLLTLIGAIPLVAINAGVTVVRIPFLGPVNFGLLYPLLIIPLAVIFAANAFNLLGGFDGIAGGTGLVITLGMFLYSIIYGTYAGALLTGVLSASIIAFLLFNIYPSKITPGDSFTYGVGTVIVVAAVLGNMESFGLVVFIPYIIEFILHARKKFKVTDLGKLRKDGTFEPPYGKKIYSWTHVIMNLKRCREWEVSLYMWLIEFGFVALAFGLKAASLL
jgi:UDP-N-acetylglucosamine--dolichyl-phosphate N-acetylglucosaminephosphotransferase